MVKNFQDVEIGETFIYSGDLYEKVSETEGVITDGVYRVVKITQRSLVSTGEKECK